MLRIRLWDEIKDFNYDSKHHGSRPVQKGILSLPNIKKMAFIVLGVEFLIQFFLSYHALVIFLIALAYSFLMFKNFYIKDFENKSFAFCLLSHQIIFFIYICLIVRLPKYIPFPIFCQIKTPVSFLKKYRVCRGCVIPQKLF